MVSSSVGEHCITRGRLLTEGQQSALAQENYNTVMRGVLVRHQGGNWLGAKKRVRSHRGDSWLRVNESTSAV